MENKTWYFYWEITFINKLRKSRHLGPELTWQNLLQAAAIISQNKSPKSVSFWWRVYLRFFPPSVFLYWIVRLLETHIIMYNTGLILFKYQTLKISLGTSVYCLVKIHFFARTLLNPFNRTPPPLTYWLLMSNQILPPHHPISDHRLSSARILLSSLSQNPLYLWCFLLVTFHPLTPPCSLAINSWLPMLYIWRSLSSCWNSFE